MSGWPSIGRHWPGRPLPGRGYPRRVFAYRRHDVDGSVWHVRESLTTVPADAPTVVYVPGLGSGSYLLGHGARLAARAKVWIVDLPGFGRSRAARRPRRVGDWADLLAAWHHAVVGEPAGYIGSSFGSQVVADCAARHPETTSRLLLVAPTFDAAARRLGPQLWRWALTTAREPLGLGPKLLVSYLQSGPATPLRGFLTALSEPSEDAVARVSVPVLVVRGEHDRIVSPSWAHTLAARAPTGSAALVPGVSHTVDYSAPDALADLSIPFLCRQEALGWHGEAR